MRKIHRVTCAVHFGRPFTKRFALHALGPLSVCPVCL